MFLGFKRGYNSSWLATSGVSMRMSLLINLARQETDDRLNDVDKTTKKDAKMMMGNIQLSSVKDKSLEPPYLLDPCSLL
ncbi:hypothetical protein PGTUg99_001976 [Puccinia graminis f. sp. tritici]|uniref:Uncharacterized protein n=1 Tax=Puccinia graminis f. sp. tritici TaxID=56615 RepID=A0A5B0NS89_PUCGR|nr:hypothetical protein PGTUg99_001976 [Puccinia graminis f. sp. tritici]